jgi:hypothetical protein
MSIYVLRTQPSNSARSLVETLGGRRLRQGGRRVWTPGDNDTVICWGESYQGRGRALNSAPLTNKLTDAIRLQEQGVPTIVVSRTRPAPAEQPAPLPDPIIERWETVNELINDWPRNFPGRNEIILQGVQEFERAITAVRDSILNGPPPQPSVVTSPIWLGRLRNHIGGRDLLNPPTNPDFWVRKEDLKHEYRVHSFLGSSIRAGKKKAVEGGPPGSTHEWIRSLLAGWKISYDGVSIKQRHRDIAHQAIKALGLHFGAVDIGEKENGDLIVLEVNRAPGLDGGTITAYSQAIRRWIDAGYPDTLPERAER